MAYAATTWSRYMQNHINEACEKVAAETEIAFLMDLLRDKFGDAPDIAPLAAVLAKLGRKAAVHAVLEAKTLDELRD